MSFVLLGILNSQAGAGGAAPSFLSSAPLWLDAADASTITESGGSVSQWDNKGTLENFTQATSADQPTTGANTLNGLNVLDFNDSVLAGDTLSNWKFLHDGTDYFVAAVVRPVSSVDALLLNTSDGNSNQVGTYVLAQRDTADQSIFSVARGVGGDSAVSYSPSGLVPTGSYSILTVKFDPDNATANDRVKAYVNDGTANTGNTQTSAPSTSNPTFLAQVGNAAQFSTQMRLAELIVVSGADATEANREEVLTYLNDKWAVF